MHELMMAESILDVVLTAAQGRTVQSLCLSVGRLHAVVPENLRLLFQLLAEGTPSAGARLEVLEIFPTVQCRRCDVITRCVRPPLGCGTCFTTDVSIVAGAELRVDELLLDDGTVVVLSDDLQPFSGATMMRH